MQIRYLMLPKQWNSESLEKKRENEIGEVQSGRERKWPVKDKMSGRWKKGAWGWGPWQTQSADKESYVEGN